MPHEGWGPKSAKSDTFFDSDAFYQCLYKKSGWGLFTDSNDSYYLIGPLPNRNVGVNFNDVTNLVVDEVLDSSHLPVLAAAVDVVGSGNNLRKLKKNF